MFQHVKNEKGLTLTEVLITVGILSVVFLGIFQVMQINYSKLHNEIGDQSERSNLRSVISYMIRDIPYAPYVKVENQSGFDTLIYEDYKGDYQIYKFSHADGLYEIADGEEKLISKGDVFDETRPMLRMENGLVILNFYAEDINALVQLSLKPRVEQ